MSKPDGDDGTAVVFLVRGRDVGFEPSCARFIASYRAHPADHAHDLVVVCKGFADRDALARIEGRFAGLATAVHEVGDEAFDIGAYRDAARLLPHTRLALLNGYSEILSPGWLGKLAMNLDRPGIGIVGASGTYERLRSDRRSSPCPNVHLRTNGLLVGRTLLLACLGEREIRSKRDARLAESGPDGLTREVARRGLGALVVGADGRGYPPWLWPRSRTFRLGRQDNLLLADNQTRASAAHPPPVRAAVAWQTWREHLAMPSPGLRPGHGAGRAADAPLD